jgi:hypothetical protein
MEDVPSDGVAQMPERRRVAKQTGQLEDRLADEAKQLREEANNLRPGAEREQLLRRARQAETGAQMSEWLRSSGLRSPQ